MLRSMTAYSRVIKNFPHVELRIEIQSQNKRVLDVQFRVPQEFALYEADMRKMLSQSISRGNLNLSVQAKFLDQCPTDLVLNKPLIKKMVTSIQELVDEMGSDELSMHEILAIVLQEGQGMLQLGQVIDEAPYKEALLDILQAAIDNLIAMKAREGKFIAEEFSQRLTKLRELMGTIIEKSQDAPLKYRAKLMELLAQFSLDDERAAKEVALQVALLAERIDIAEELSRFSLHLAHFQEVMNKALSEGKTLEFILQELSREINTIGSKSQDGAISALVIEVKSELEKIREQVQNVE